MELETHGLRPSSPARTVNLDLSQPADRARSRVLHRLRVLEIPGFTRQRGPAWATDATTMERWLLACDDTAESVQLEAAGWGPTLAAAATARLEEALASESLDAARATGILGEAIFIGINGLTDRAIEAVRHHVQHDPLLENVGGALDRLLSAYLHDSLFGARGSAALAAAIREAFSRATWLLEHVVGGSSPRDAQLIGAVRALKLTATTATGMGLDVQALRDALTRCMADTAAPPALCGAALGAAWCLGALQGGTADVVHAIRRASHPTVLGAFLAGLFALAREEFTATPDLMARLNDVLVAMDEQDFLIALPSLRLAFTYFPPREKANVAQLVARWHNLGDTSGHALLRLDAKAEEIAAFSVADARADVLFRKFGLAARGGQP